MKYHQEDSTKVYKDRYGNATCDNCGWVLSDDWTFCPNCGMFIDWDKVEYEDA